MERWDLVGRWRTWGRDKMGISRGRLARWTMPLSLDHNGEIQAVSLRVRSVTER